MRQKRRECESGGAIKEAAGKKKILGGGERKKIVKGGKGTDLETPIGGGHGVWGRREPNIECSSIVTVRRKLCKKALSLQTSRRGNKLRKKKLWKEREKKEGQSWKGGVRGKKTNKFVGKHGGGRGIIYRERAHRRTEKKKTKGTPPKSNKIEKTAGGKIPKSDSYWGGSRGVKMRAPDRT